MAKSRSKPPTQPASAPVVTAVLGPARSGKTHQLLELYRAELGRQPLPLDRTLWLAPNGRAAAQVRQQLLSGELAGCMSPGVTTFESLTKTILASCPFASRANGNTQGATLTLLQPIAARELLRRVVEQAGENSELTFYRDAARRAGFVELLAEHIRELKRHALTPAIYRKARPPHVSAEQHRELALLYEAYETELASHGLLDSEGAHWAARDALAGGKCARFEQLDLIVVDGFTDFSPIQQEILELLAKSSQRLVVSLPIADDRPDLFAKVGASLVELRHRYPQLQTEVVAPRGTTLPRRSEEGWVRAGWPALDYLTQNVFGHPAKIAPPSVAVLKTLDRIEIIEAAGAHDEIVQLARRIKARLTSPLPFRAKLTSPLPFREGPGEGSDLSLPPGEGRGEGESPQRDAPSPCPLPKGEGVKGVLPKGEGIESALISPADITVVFRTLGDVAPRVREVFDEFGIPYALGPREKLASQPLVKSLLALLRLAEEDWPFRRVVSTLMNFTFTSLAPDARQAADWLVRDLQIASGREKLLERVAQLAEDESPESHGEHAAERSTKAKIARPALGTLAAAVRALPAEATPTEWCAALAEAGATLGLAPFVTPASPPRTGRLSDQSEAASSFASSECADRDAWNTIQIQFAHLERLDSLLGQPPRTLTRGELIAALLDVANHETMSSPHDEVGRVHVLDATAARTVCAKHLFLAGMSEQAFPKPERAGRLATDADYQFHARVANQELAVQQIAAPTRAQDEMLLFYEVLSRAEETLTISYPALDDKAQALPPSPYITEIERVLGEDGKDRNPLPWGEGRVRGHSSVAIHPHPGPLPEGEGGPNQRVRRSKPQLAPVPQQAMPYSPIDLRIQAVGRALTGEPALLAGMFAAESASASVASLAAGVRIVHARAHGESFGPAEGLLASPAVAQRLAEKFGPKHPWSPSQWESYASCPYRFFLEGVLRLEPLGDLVLETDFARRGSRLHDVLATFHRDWPGIRDSKRPDAGDEAAQFLAHLQHVIDDRIAVSSRSGIDAALLELDRRQLRKWADAHFEHHENYGKLNDDRKAQLTPTHFEFRFGKPRPGGESDPNSVETPYVIMIDDEPIQITGQIDRIDVGEIEGRRVFNVIDYKSGRKSNLKREQLKSGEKLQLPIYVEAAQMLLFGDQATPLVAGYWSMAGGFDAKGALAVVAEDADAHWNDVRDMTRQLIRRFVHAIRHGEFPVASLDDKCTSYCNFNTICRVAQVRSLHKEWPPPNTS